MGRGEALTDDVRFISLNQFHILLKAEQLCYFFAGPFSLASIFTHRNRKVEGPDKPEC